jgi:hypothetical protein
VRGRLDGAHSMSVVNDALRDTFERFDLATTPHGVLVRPVLGRAAAARIMADLERAPAERFPDWERWPHGTTLRGYPAVPWRDATVVLGAEEDEDLAGAELRPADPPPELVQKVEPIVPPLRPIEAESASSQESWHLGL